jgi:ketosteroid isomerase-like protein
MDFSTEKVRETTIEIEAHLRQLNEEWVKAMMRADAPTLDRIMSDDFFFTYPLEGDDKASVISDLTSGELKIEHFARDHVSVRVFASTAVLTADEAYSGDTFVTTGTLQVGNGGTTGSVVGNIVDNGTLAINRSNSSRCSSARMTWYRFSMSPSIPDHSSQIKSCVTEH